MTEGTAARGAALEILRRVRAGQLFQTARDTAVAELPESDRRLAHEIAAGVLRQRTTLDRQLKPLVSGDWRRTPSDLKDLLRIGAFQLLVLDRVPPYGAVDATVEVAKQAHGSRSAGLVNAVLRKVAAHGAAPAPSGPRGARSEALAEEYSHPAWLVARWVERFGRDRTRALLVHNNRPPPLTVQPARWSPDQLREAWVQHGIQFATAAFGLGFTVEGTRVQDLPGYREGGFVVQDAAQARLLECMAMPAGSTVWDACAAPGGKAVVLSRTCRVIASDVARRRLERTRTSVRRAGGPSLWLLLADVGRPPVNPGALDVVLVDAPCTATGTFARHPDARWRVTPTRLAGAVRLQAALLDGAAEAVRKGGALMYFTCSLEVEENAEQVDRFLARHPTFARDRRDLFLFPPESGTDGGFGAKLRRVR